MKKFWILLGCLVCATSASAETEYMCKNIPFVPNKPLKESCGWRCGPATTTLNYLVVDPDYYAKYSYAKAKSMYDAGKCDRVYTVRRYTDKCGGNAVVKKTAYSTWTEIKGGNDACRMKQYQNYIKKERDEIERLMNESR